VDANVLNEPTRSDPDPAVVDWLRANEWYIVVNPIILRSEHLSLDGVRVRSKIVPAVTDARPPHPEHMYLHVIVEDLGTWIRRVGS
jgi:hypothetical protein